MESAPVCVCVCACVHLYKKKGDRTNCDNHRGISLLSVAGKVLARTMQIRLSDHVVSTGILVSK